MYLAIWRLSGVDGVSRIESVAAGRMTERLRFNRYTSQKIPQTPALPAFSPPPPDEAEPCGHATDSEHAHGRRLRDGGNREGDGVPGRMLDLSGARSSGTEPSILMGDEPTGNLDSRTGADVIALLRKLNVDRSLTVVLVTHDQQVARHADRTIVLRDGLALSRKAVRMVRQKNGPMICAEADFCITGTISSEQLPEGPFGDHLGYYSLTHDFPVINVETVYHRKDAIWPFTVVGRPPQEDTVFGELIHELTGPAIPTVLPGVNAVHAVDESGVHPLLLALGSERYVPYSQHKQPQELLTNANAILGQGQLSLAKYLIIAAKEDSPNLDINDTEAFFRHVLERVNLERDLHFQTRTTMDTLDYSGTGLNEGSKLVIAAAGRPVRSLQHEISSDLHLPEGFNRPTVCFPGVLAVQAPAWSVGKHEIDPAASEFCDKIPPDAAINKFPLIILCDDSQFCAKSLANFLWVTFTRSNPAADVYGIGSSIRQKHWGCSGSLVIDARIKAHMAPALEANAEVSRRVDRLFQKGGSLHGFA